MLWYRHQTGLLFPVTFGSGIILCWHTGTTVVHRTRPPPLGHPYSLCCKHTETFLIATTVSRYQVMKAPCPAVSKLQKATISFDDDVLTLSIIAHFPEVQPRGHKNRLLYVQKKRLDGRKQKNICTAVPVRKRTVLLIASCDAPSRITCNQIITGTYPWYISTQVHPKKNTRYIGTYVHPKKNTWYEKRKKGNTGDNGNTMFQ